MIDVLDRVERRNFVHRKLIGEAVKFASAAVPGGSTALKIGSVLVGGGPRRAGRLGKAGRKQCRAQGGTVVRTPGQPTRCAPPGPAGPSGTRRVRPSSIPPVNPVRAAVVQAKAVEPIKAAIHIAPRRTIPPIAPRSSTTPVGFRPPTLRPPTMDFAMPIHSRTRRTISDAFVGGDNGCFIPGQRRDQFGQCSFFVGERVGPEDISVGEPVMGQFGAAYVPGNKIIDRAVCLKGDVVGSDGLCYPKRSIRNKDREWPRGRRPLLTGGDMRAISVAHRAASRLTRTAGRLQDMGLIKKPIVRKFKKKN